MPERPRGRVAVQIGRDELAIGSTTIALGLLTNAISDAVPFPVAIVGALLLGGAAVLLSSRIRQRLSSPASPAERRALIRHADQSLRAREQIQALEEVQLYVRVPPTHVSRRHRITGAEEVIPSGNLPEYFEDHLDAPLAILGPGGTGKTASMVKIGRHLLQQATMTSSQDELGHWFPVWLQLEEWTKGSASTPGSLTT
jgi:hypothetical protein